MLLKLESFQYAMSLDLNMGYYHTRLSKKSSNLCTIILPWGKYWYKHLPMGVANSPENSQQKTKDLFHALEFIHALHKRPFDLNKRRLVLPCTEFEIKD